MPFQLGANNEGDSIIRMSTGLDAAQANTPHQRSFNLIRVMNYFN